MCTKAAQVLDGLHGLKREVFSDDLFSKILMELAATFPPCIAVGHRGHYPIKTGPKCHMSRQQNLKLSNEVYMLTNNSSIGEK